MKFNAVYIGIWLNAARPRTLPAAASPVIMGAALAVADKGFYLPAAAAALIGALLIQIAANYANDYYDFIRGADTEERIGPVRATQAGLVRPAQMWRALWVTMALSVLPGLYLIYRGGWPILLIGVLSLLFALLYTGGPWPLGYLGIADLFVLVFFGPIAVAGTYYVQTGTLRFVPIIAGFGPGLLSMAILTVNNLRDIEQDRQAGKKTLAVRFGRRVAQYEYLVAVGIAIVAVPSVLCVMEGARWGALAAVLMIVPAARCVKIVFTVRDGVTLNNCLADTGKILLGFSLLFSLGWLV